MKYCRFICPMLSSVGIAILALTAPAAIAQGTTTQGASSGNVLGLLSTTFSGGNPVQQVQLSGNAIWYAGSLEDTGTVTLTASAGGSSQMQLLLAATGQRTETQTGTGLNTSCQWAGADGVAHQVDFGNCWKSAQWFLPALSLYPASLPSNLSIVDLGMNMISTTGSDTNVYRHLQSQLVISSLPSNVAAIVAQNNTADLGLNPASLLPTIYAYSVHPDNGAQTLIAIEIHYSDYHTVNGVKIPFTIQRYVNGALQLHISVNSAQIN